MATTKGAVRVDCRSCRWRGTRVLHDPLNPNHGADRCGFGPCPTCGGRLKRSSFQMDRRAAQAKAELQELEQGARL